jgi:hypothetical protein
MNRSNLIQALVGSAMALSVSSGAHARPMVWEPRDDVTFSLRASKATPAPSVSLNLSGRSFDHAGPPALHGGPVLFGAPSADNGKSFSFGSPNSHANLDAPSQGHSQGHSQDHSQDHGQVVTEKTFEGLGQQGASPVSAVPEPATYALLALGLAGIAAVRRRRR